MNGSVAGTPRVLPYGELALLVECGEELVAAVHASIASAGLPITDVVPAARTVLVRVAVEGDLAAVRERVADLLVAPPPPRRPRPSDMVMIPVRYDGADLADVAALTGLSPAEVVNAHTGRPWRVAFCGFSPGFAYLDGGDPRLEVPRRPDPRTEVPAGAVGLAGSFSGIYPRRSPGGWQLLGHTDAVIWNPHLDPPALLHPGRWVRFKAVAR